MKKPIEGSAPTPEVLRRIKEAAARELTRELLEPLELGRSAYPSLVGTTGDEPVYAGMRRVLDAVLDYRYKAKGTSENTVAAAEQEFKSANKTIPRKEAEQLIGKIMKVANRLIDDGYLRQRIESETEENAARQTQETERKIQLARETREALFSSALPANHSDRRRLRKVERSYVLATDPAAIASLRGSLKETLVCFMGATRASEGRLLENNAPQRADAIIDAIDSALAGSRAVRVVRLPALAIGGCNHDR